MVQPKRRGRLLFATGPRRVAGLSGASNGGRYRRISRATSMAAAAPTAEITQLGIRVLARVRIVKRMGPPPKGSMRAGPGRPPGNG
ncbi:hypothetical protein JCM13210_24190 [Thermaerobacter litoralis]